jgi:site-specific DNA-methyltransferase (adenine-specific)
MDIQLYNGDCLELMKKIPDGSVDLVLCDLPYGTTRNKWDSIIPLDRLWEQYKRVIKDNGAIALFSAEPFTSLLITSNIQWFRYDLIWSKTQGSDFLNANRKPLRSHENICVFYKKQPTYNPQKTDGKPYKAKSGETTSSNFGKFNGNHPTENKDGKRCPLSVLRFSGEHNRGKQHPTQKPTALLEWLVKTYTNEGDLVLDNCMGSGSTGVACVNTNRNFIGIELDKGYFDIAEKRINEAQNI